MSLSIKEGFLGDNVELHVHTLLVEVGANERNELYKSLHTLECGGVELLVEESTVGRYALLELCHGVGGSGRSLDISAGRRANAVCEGRVS